MRLAEGIRAGQVYVNATGVGTGVELPFGGYKHSGWGREKGLEALASYTQTEERLHRIRGPVMRYRTLGEQGPAVSVVGVGGNNFGSRLDEEGTKAVVHAALDAGITLFDTADMYGGFGERGGARGDGERLLGAALKGRRDEVVLATKFGMEMGPEADLYGRRGARPYIRYAVEASLRRLGTDRIDLYQYHEPDGVTPLEETVAALPELVDEGEIRPHRLLQPAGRGAHRRLRVHPGPLPPARPQRGERPDPRLPAPRRRRCCRTTRWPTACSAASTGAARSPRPAAGCPGGRAGSPTRPSTGSRRSPRTAPNAA